LGGGGGELGRGGWGASLYKTGQGILSLEDLYGASYISKWVNRIVYVVLENTCHFASISTVDNFNVSNL